MIGRVCGQTKNVDTFVDRRVSGNSPVEKEHCPVRGCRSVFEISRRRVPVRINESIQSGRICCDVRGMSCVNRWCRWRGRISFKVDKIKVAVFSVTGSKQEGDVKSCLIPCSRRKPDGFEDPGPHG